jgi:D-alanyl-D-alanine carboxypeptidase
MSALHSRLAAALVLAAGLLPAAAAAAPPTAPAVQRALDRLVAAGAPGAIALADGHVSVSGVADLRTRRPLRAGDRIRIGSVTKTFVAVVALQLVGEGRLALDDTVGARLPGVLPYADGVTLRQLLDHTSGVPDDVPAVLMQIFHGDPLRIWTPGQLIGLAGNDGLRFPAGAGWAYSNTDYVLAALMIERATGHSLERELADRIVRPLGLRRTSFPVRAATLPAPASHGYSLELDAHGRPQPGPLRDVSRSSPSFGWGSANGVSDVRDLARFYRALLDGRLLSPWLLREALTTVDTGQPGRRYGLGIERRGALASAPASTSGARRSLRSTSSSAPPPSTRRSTPHSTRPCAQRSPRGRGRDDGVDGPTRVGAGRHNRRRRDGDGAGAAARRRVLEHCRRGADRRGGRGARAAARGAAGGAGRDARGGHRDRRRRGGAERPLRPDRARRDSRAL